MPGDLIKFKVRGEFHDSITSEDPLMVTIRSKVKDESPATVFRAVRRVVSTPMRASFTALLLEVIAPDTTLLISPHEITAVFVDPPDMLDRHEHYIARLKSRVGDVKKWTMKCALRGLMFGTVDDQPPRDKRLHICDEEVIDVIVEMMETHQSDS
jgi:hypothetical protein